MLKRLFCLGAILASVTLSTTTVAQRTPHIVFMIGEDEYHTWETLPDFAKRELEPKGYQVTIIQQDEKDKNNFPGLVDALRSADLLFVSVRRRTPPVDQLNAVRAHLEAFQGEDRRVYAELGRTALALAREGGLEESQASKMEALLNGATATAR